MSESGATTTPATTPPAFAPEGFGKYYLIDKVAVGGMAEIFKAKSFGEGGFENVFIIKRILQHMSENEQFIQMFLDEARITAMLQHANIVRIWDFGKIQTNYFLAMDCVEGKDVKHVLRKMYALGKQLHIQLAVYIAMEAAKGLDYAHKKQSNTGQDLHIVHRDISPSNILVSYNGEVKVADFGIVKSAVVHETTSAGTLKGKFEYMSPEQASGIEVDRRSDIFSLGIVLWEMLTGRRAFKAESEIKTLERVKMVDLDAPSALNPQVPAKLDAIVKKALSARLEDRYQDARQFQSDLLDFLYPATPDYVQHTLSTFMQTIFAEEIAGERHRHEENSRLARALHESASQMDLEPDWQETPSGTRPNAPPPPSSRNSLLAVAGVMAAVAVATIGPAVWIVTRPDPTPPQVPQPVEIQKTTATAIIRITPAATKVRLDGAEVGTGAEVDLKDLPPGEHTLEVEAEGYQAYTDTFSVEAGEIMRLAVNLTKVGEPPAPPPPVTTEDDPKADARKKEEERKREEDARRREEEKKREAERLAALEAMKNTPTEKKEEKKEEKAADGKLSVNVKNGWAEVWIDGKKVGNTPIFGKVVSAGSHTVRAKNDELGLDQTKSVTVKSGETASVSFSP